MADEKLHLLEVIKKGPEGPVLVALSGTCLVVGRYAVLRQSPEYRAGCHHIVLIAFRGVLEREVELKESEEIDDLAAVVAWRATSRPAAVCVGTR